ncbi:MAG TPA: ATP-binding cassette domain-containing protein [bacterium]|nr:ATP-binding cassette domain-containing protein [bacterium]
MLPLLSIRHLSAHFFVEQQLYKAVDDVSFDIMPEETLCLVGESGSGKSITALSVLDLLPYPGLIAGGEIYWQNEKL